MPGRRFTTLAIAGFVATTLALAGCAAAIDGTAGHSRPHAAGTWTSDDGSAWLTLEDHRVTGSDGCNGVKGSYTVDGDTVAFEMGLMTRKACAGVTLSFRALTSAVIEDDHMRVFDADGVELVVLVRGGVVPTGT